MTQPSDFQRAYFIQTRQEIDTDKKIRDTTLNFAVFVLGAVGFVVLKSDNAGDFVRSTNGFVLSLSALLIITSLFYARREKMTQIVDRWFVLHHLLKQNPDWLGTECTLEALVSIGFSEPRRRLQRYITKDFWLSTAFCCPLFPATVLFQPVVGLLVTLAFLLLIALLHLRKIPDPLNKIRKDDQQAAV